MELLLLELILILRINRLIKQAYKHIIESTKKQTKVSTKKSLTDNLLKRFLELEFKQHQSN